MTPAAATAGRTDRTARSAPAPDAAAAGRGENTASRAFRAALPTRRFPRTGTVGILGDPRRSLRDRRTTGPSPRPRPLARRCPASRFPRPFAGSLVRAARRPAPAVAAEVCEPRLLLSAVTVDVDGDDLKIRGDDGIDYIFVEGQGNGRYVITGAGTTVNGTDRVVVDGVFGSMDIDLEGGDDVVAIFNAVLSDDLKVELGDGADFLGVYTAAIGDDLEVSGGDAEQNGAALAAGPQNTLVFDSVTVGDDAVVTGDDGADAFYFTNVAVADEFVVETGDEAALVVFNGLRARDVRVETGDGNDLVYAFNVRVEDDVRLNLNDGDDALIASNAVVGDTLEYDANDGFDSAFLSGSFADDLELNDVERELFG